MAEVGGIQGGNANTSLKQQTKLEGADRAISQRESKLTQTTQANTTGGNSVAKATPAKTEGVRTGAENNLQQQAESLSNNAANAAQQGKPAQGEVGQNVNEFA